MLHRFVTKTTQKQSVSKIEAKFREKNREVVDELSESTCQVQLRKQLTFDGGGPLCGIRDYRSARENKGSSKIKGLRHTSAGLINNKKVQR